MIMVSLMGMGVTCLQAQNLLPAVDFDGGSIKPWLLFESDKATGTASVSAADGILIFDADEKSAKEFHRQLILKGIRLKADQKYLLTFNVKYKGPEQQAVLPVRLTRSIHHDKPHYGLWRNVDLTDQWVTVKLKFSPRDLDPEDPPALKLSLGEIKGQVLLKEIQLETTGINYN